MKSLSPGQLAACTAAIGVAGLLSCSHNIQNKEAVRQGVLDHLARGSGLDLKTMDIEVTSVSFRQNQASATLHFQPKEPNTPGGGLQLTYNLDRQGDRWVVKGKPISGDQPHGVEGMLPPAGGELPPGHPSTGSRLPPGHPSIDNPARPVK